METALWMDWRGPCEALAGVDRAYLGHETCQYLLPPADIAAERVRFVRDSGIAVTLVMPFLTDAGIGRVCRLVERLLKTVDALEVVCSDWGLLHYLSRQNMGTPVVGRLLAGQQVDPRMGRILSANAEQTEERSVTGADGTQFVLRRKGLSDSLAAHCRTCWIDKPAVINLLVQRGITRCEVSNTIQGIELGWFPGWSYSLHVTDVPIAVMRRCPGAGEDFNQAAECEPWQCGETAARWSLPGIQTACLRRANALYYLGAGLPANMGSLPVDRIVYRRTGELPMANNP